MIHYKLTKDCSPGGGFTKPYKKGWVGRHVEMPVGDLRILEFADGKRDVFRLTDLQEVPVTIPLTDTKQKKFKRKKRLSSKTAALHRRILSVLRETQDYWISTTDLISIMEDCPRFSLYYAFGQTNRERTQFSLPKLGLVMSRKGETAGKRPVKLWKITEKGLPKAKQFFPNWKESKESKKPQV